MKLTIGENIRNFRKKNDLTQEALADRLGVSYQSVSRWEIGTTYPDLELIPAIAEILAVTVDELLGMSQIEKEKRAAKTFDELRRECIKRDYDADKIVNLLRDIRRNYLDSDYAWRPWVEGNNRAFRDPKILPEVRLFAEAYFSRHPMSTSVIRTMANIEDEEHLDDFLKKYTTATDCSRRALLFDRYWKLRDAERFEPERKFQLYDAFRTLLCSLYLHNWEANCEIQNEADEFMENMLALIRGDAADDRPDMWVADRLELGLKSAARAVANGEIEGAIIKINKAVELLEETMKITDEVSLPTSCRFLDGMECRAKEQYDDRYNDPDGAKYRLVSMEIEIQNVCTDYLIYPEDYLETLKGKRFASLHNHPGFEKLCERIKALVVKREK
ncbi:MAG: helix-turn-helix domain-containing protein [Clostridia bacterium]|nr:helix-turn-helix domain-containing protein [Clostridia bacterium]